MSVAGATGPPCSLPLFQMSVDHPPGLARGAGGATGVVVIGRNEGERLRRCLESVCGLVSSVVYVDSGSTDDSVALGRALGAIVVVLDHRVPYTAARARNEGFRKLLEIEPTLDYVLFVDGDCEVAAGWVERGAGFLDEHPEVAIVWGQRREQHPEKSVYNMLCDIEWRDYPSGDVKACGGDIVARTVAIKQVKGYRPELICGEEPEMCVRLRQAGWRIWRLGDVMTLHDAAMYSFSQWWKRALRGGYASAQGVALHGAAPERHCVTESRRTWVWGLCVPLAVIGITHLVGWWGLLLLMVYPLQVIRLALLGRRSTRENWWRAGALVLSKFPGMLGQLKFFLDRYRHVTSRLIEYK
jgi:glycosyltransferase involved in cell wall biosynthesis